MISKSQAAAGFLQKATHAMFKTVGFKGFCPKLAQQDEWYTKREWTKSQREEFRKWFVANAREDLRLTKKAAEREFSYFDLMWGWKEKEDRKGGRGQGALS